MTASELMVGDLVQSTEGKFWKLVSRDGRLYFLSLEKERGVCLRVPAAFLDMSGIPLTTEILEANGFKYHENVNCYTTKGVSIHYDERGLGKHEIVPREMFTILVVGCGFYEIKYVHQLQLLLRLCERWDMANDFKLAPGGEAPGTVTEKR